MVVIVKEEVREEGSAVVTGLIRAGVGPLASDGLDEALGFAIGLGSIRSGEVMSEAELSTGGSEVFGAVGRAAVGQDAPDFDAVELVEGDGLVEGVEDARDFFIWEKAGEGEAGVIINGDVEAFDAGARAAAGAIAGGPDAGALEAAELLDIEVEEFAGMSVFVTNDGRLGRFERGQALELVTTQNARKGGLGNGQQGQDLSVGAALAAQGEDMGFELGAGFAGLAQRDRGAVLELRREAALARAQEPAADRPFADVVGGADGAEGQVVGSEMRDHFCSHQGRKSGISVHVVRAGRRWVWFSSTTILDDLFRADNVLKHDT